MFATHQIQKLDFLDLLTIFHTELVALSLEENKHLLIQKLMQKAKRMFVNNPSK